MCVAGQITKVGGVGKKQRFGNNPFWTANWNYWVFFRKSARLSTFWAIKLLSSPWKGILCPSPPPIEWSISLHLTTPRPSPPPTQILGFEPWVPSKRLLLAYCRFVCRIPDCTVGLCSALDTMCGQAYGAEKPQLVGIYLQRMVVITTVATGFIFLLWSFAEELLLALGQDPVVAKLSQEYIFAIMPGFWPVVRCGFSSRGV